MFGRSGGFFYTGPQTCVLEEFIVQGYWPIFFHVPVFLKAAAMRPTIPMTFGATFVREDPAYDPS